MNINYNSIKIQRIMSELSFYFEDNKVDCKITGTSVQ